MTELLFNTIETEFVLHKHTVGSKIDYQLSVKDGDELRFLSFNRTGEMATISDVPNVTKLCGTLSEDTRSLPWLDYEGQTKMSEGEEDVDGKTIEHPGIYEIIDSGKATIGKQTEDYSEIYLSGSLMSDRWIIRKLPNLFPLVFEDQESIHLLWKPPLQKSFNSALDISVPYNEVVCPCPIKDSSAKFAELVKLEGVSMNSSMVTDISFDKKNHTFVGIGGAEGTWVDMFNNKYTYTPEFLTHHYNEQKAQLAEGKTIPVNTNHALEHEFEGEITNVTLVREPIYHIKVEGTYNGSADLDDEQFGLSYEYKLRSSWNEEFQSWVPFSAITEKISVVKRPACKICWIKKVG